MKLERICENFKYFGENTGFIPDLLGMFTRDMM